MADVGGRAFGADVGVMVVSGGVVRQALAELLEVEAAAHLVHLLAGRAHGGQEREHASHQDAGRDGDVGPSERDAGRDEVEDRSFRGPIGHEGNRPGGEPHRRLDDFTIFQPSLQAKDELIGPDGQIGVTSKRRFGGFTGGAFELTEGVIEQVVWFHRINRSHLVGTLSPFPGAWPGQRAVST